MLPNKTRRGGARKRHECRCLRIFKCAKTLEKHMLACGENSDAAVKMESLEDAFQNEGHSAMEYLEIEFGDTPKDEIMTTHHAGAPNTEAMEIDDKKSAHQLHLPEAAYATSIEVGIDTVNSPDGKFMEKTEEFVNSSSTDYNEAESSDELEPGPVTASGAIYKCQICPRKYSTRAGLKKHKQVHTGRFKCGYCDKSFHSAANLKAHFEKHQNNSSASASDLKKHVLIHTEHKHVCEICGCHFSNSVALEEHKKLHLNIRPYNCQFCWEKFATSSGLRIHQNKDHMGHKVVVEFSETTAETDAPPYVCSICSKAYDCRRRLQVHRNKHTSRFHLEIAANSEVHVRQHLVIHPYQCTVCKAVQTSAYALRTHREEMHPQGETYRKVHLNTEQLKCSSCAETFLTINELRRHRNGCISINPAFEGQISNPSDANESRSHCPDESEMLNNNEAVTESKTPSSINANDLNHPEGLFMCGYCNKRFLTTGALAKHRSTHFRLTENKRRQPRTYVKRPVKCCRCCRVFTDAKILEKHQQAQLCWPPIRVEMEAEEDSVKGAYRDAIIKEETTDSSVAPTEAQIQELNTVDVKEIKKEQQAEEIQKTHYQITKFTRETKTAVSFEERKAQNSKVEDAEQENLIIEVIDEATEKHCHYSVKKSTVSTNGSGFINSPTEESHLSNAGARFIVVQTENTELSQEEKVSPIIFKEFQERESRQRFETNRKNDHNIAFEAFDETQDFQFIKTECSSPTLDAENEQEFLSEEESCAPVLGSNDLKLLLRDEK